MAQVIAITEIVRNIEPGVPANKEKGTKAIPPKSKKILPGTLFVSEGDELATLRKARAVRDPEAADIEARRRPVTDDEEEAPVARSAKPAKAAKTSKSAKGEAETEGSNGDGDGANLV